MRNIDDILDRIKEIKSLKTDTEMSKLFSVTPQTISTWRKRGTIPYNSLVTLCEREGMSLDWLLTGEGPMKKYEAPEEKPLTGVREASTIYNVREDPDLAEIVSLLEEFPQDKRLILKLLKGKKEIREALEGIEIKDILKEEG